MKIKEKINKTGNWLWSYRVPIFTGVAAITGVLAGLSWEHQDVAKKVKDKAPEVIEKIEEEGGKRTNELGRLEIWK